MASAPQTTSSEPKPEKAAAPPAAAPAAGAPAAAQAPAPRANDSEGGAGPDFGVLRKVPMSVQVEVGRTVMTLGEILDELDVGASIRLDRHPGDPVEVYVNGTLFARAEVVIEQDQIGAKIIELVDPTQVPRPSGLR